MNKFAPLTTYEIEAATVHSPSAQYDPGVIIMPVPPDAPPTSAEHFQYGNPTAVWKYRDADGALLFEVHRFDPPGERKQFLPLSLWREPSGALRWRWKGLPVPRPLYNLDKVAANPQAPVVICEGEKAADAAARIFRKSVSITSPGGSQAATKADWTPLDGRLVLIWPDADAPGEKYAREVAEILAGLGCEVSIIDAMALASMSPDGGMREPVPGWDTADAVDDWQDLAALAKAAHGLAKPYQAGPAFISCGAFTMGSDGLTIETTKGKGDNAETVEEWICAPFEVVGATRDGDGREWGKWLRWRDGDGRKHVRHVGEAALQGEPGALAASLASDGLRINRAQQRALASYLSAVTVKARVTMVSRTGWHCIGGRDVFVLPGEVLGPRGSENVILDSAAVGPYQTHGTLKDWQEGVATLAAEHALAVLSISAAFAGPLLYLAGQEGGGIHNFGPSSLGKSTLLFVAASVWGRGALPGYVRAWRATANGLEGAAASATDTVLILDELGMIEAREFQAASYALANGSGKTRSARNGDMREPKSWRVLVISSGEISSAAKLSEEKGRKARAGQLVRFLDIPADKSLGFGAFDHGGPDGDADGDAAMSAPWSPREAKKANERRFDEPR